MHLNKSKFGQSLRQSLVKKYLLDWQRSNDVKGPQTRHIFIPENLFQIREISHTNK